MNVTQVVLPGQVEPSGLILRERPLAPPGDQEVVVRVEATGVAFAEQQMRRGRYPGQPAFPFVPGYDLVGTVHAVGAGVPSDLVGQRVAAVTKTGGWASHAVVMARDLVLVPADLAPVLVETVLVNGVTAWQMLHRDAKVQPGQTILVHGANGGVGTVLCQLALHHGIRVMGTASPRHHDALRSAGVEPLDYNDPDLSGSVRSLAPRGVEAVFDHLGLESSRQSYGLLAPGGSLICYGTAASRNGSVLVVFLKMIAQILAWKLLSPSRAVSFYNFWGGSWLRPAAFRQRLREDLASLFDLLSRGAIEPPVAATFPLSEASAALELAESRTVRGKVVITP